MGRIEDLRGAVRVLDEVLGGPFPVRRLREALQGVRSAVAAAAAREERDRLLGALEGFGAGAQDRERRLGPPNAIRRLRREPGHRVSVEGTVVVGGQASAAELVLRDQDGSVIAAASGSAKRHPEDPPSYDVGLRLALGRAFAQLGLALVDGLPIVRGDERA